MIEAVARRHPRGGRVHTVIGQIVVIRMDLRSGDISNTVEETWSRDRDDFEEMALANAALSPEGEK
jgi:hypothetical protein